ncbi:hypothetical protein [Tolypothrix sp. FACHB-123]|uniref:hypothetical protein n=1 Tax=Tolypothrix sp. FACHB-123 TaxID=2692868 RepID=UPI001F55854E|nr:hypothetical protein [Tolypothrix sp. FACHB-123]
MSDFTHYQYQLMPEDKQTLPRQTICQDCAFHTQTEGGINCIHPDELQVNCSQVIFCNSFQPSQEIDSPCVTFDG